MRTALAALLVVGVSAAGPTFAQQPQQLPGHYRHRAAEGDGSSKAGGYGPVSASTGPAPRPT